MSRRWSTVRKRDEEEQAGVDISRLLVIGFLTAALLGLLIGLVWVGWKLLRNQLGG